MEEKKRSKHRDFNFWLSKQVKQTGEKILLIVEVDI